MHLKNLDKYQVEKILYVGTLALKTKMSKEIRTTIEIEASPEKVWQVLTDFENFSNWNPFIQTIGGKKEVGKHLETTICPPNRKPMQFKPVILKFDTNKELRL